MTEATKPAAAEAAAPAVAEAIKPASAPVTEAVQPAAAEGAGVSGAFIEESAELIPVRIVYQLLLFDYDRQLIHLINMICIQLRLNQHMEYQHSWETTIWDS